MRQCILIQSISKLLILFYFNSTNTGYSLLISAGFYLIIFIISFCFTNCSNNEDNKIDKDNNQNYLMNDEEDKNGIQASKI